MKTKLEFKVEIDTQIKGEKQFGFELICIPEGKDRIRWRIRKQEENIRALNQKIEDECRVTVPFYYRILSSVTERESRREDRLSAYRNYIEKLLESRKYYCPSLFQFIRFDPIKLQTRVMGTRISLNDLAQMQRKSHYMEEFEDSGEIIEVLRVDRLLEDSYKIYFRRKMFKLQKTTDQFKFFRENLNKLYRGVSRIPDFDIKDCRKVDVKYRVQKFLRGVEGLPKVKISKHFKNFYENSVYQDE